ncbi:MAG TPA: DNA repair protein RadC [Acidobacteriota bacterium]|jgi:DNA repair protein RadC
MRIREISVRYAASEVRLEEGESFRNSRQVFEAFRQLALEPVEVFRVILLDGKNRMLFYEDISRGSLTGALVHPREVFWSAIHHRAAAIICLHNHPSGDPEPSAEDREITARLKQAGDLLGIRVLDHIVIGDGCYVSFQDRGEL